MSYSPGSQDVYPSALMRLRTDELMPRLDELMVNAQQIRNDQRDLLAKIQALAADNIKLHLTKTHVDDLTALESRVHRAQETLASVDARLAEVRETVKGLDAAFERYQDTHATTHQFDDARMTDLRATNKELHARVDELEKQQSQVVANLAMMERRLAALEQRADDLQETVGTETMQNYRERVASLERRLAALESDDTEQGTHQARGGVKG